jgi:hypothetical protein
MKTYKGNRDIAPPIPHLAIDGRNWSPSSPGRFPPVNNLVLIGYEREWTTEPVWAFCRIEILLALTGFRHPCHPARNLNTSYLQTGLL